MTRGMVRPEAETDGGLLLCRDSVERRKEKITADFPEKSQRWKEKTRIEEGTKSSDCLRGKS